MIVLPDWSRARQRVAARCGFTPEAVLRSFLLAKDGRQDMVEFGLLAGDIGGVAQPTARSPRQL
jgi:RimJ/RimL family protein N-acetyltransferase